MLKSLLFATVMIVALRAAAVQAQEVVFDPTNFVENVMTAANTLQQVTNQIQSLQNESRMLENQARNLTSLEGSSMGQFDAQIARIGTLLNQAEGLLYNVSQVQAEYQRLYPASYLSIGIEKGPRIGVEKGPLFGVARQGSGPLGLGTVIGCEEFQARFLNRQLSLPVSTISQW